MALTKGAGTRSSPIAIDDSEEEIFQELCNNSSQSSASLRSSPNQAGAKKRKPANSNTSQSAQISGPSRSSQSPPALGARKRRRKQERKQQETQDRLQNLYAHPSLPIPIWRGPLPTYYSPMVKLPMGSGGSTSVPFQSYSDLLHTLPPLPVPFKAQAAESTAHSQVQNQELEKQTPAFLPPPPITTSSITYPTELTSTSQTSSVHALPPKPPPEVTQIIGMKPDQDPNSKHGTFYIPVPTQNAGITSKRKFYQPNPARTLVMEQLPKTHLTTEFINKWSKGACDAHPVHLSIDGQGGKALIEFATAKLARKAWGSRKLGSAYAGLKSHQLKGKPREDLIKVWWYRVDGVGAGSGVGEIEEGEIEGDAAVKELNVNKWSKGACDAHPVHLSIDGQGGKALIEFATAELARKACVNVVTNHLESVLDFVNTHQVDEDHYADLTTIISQTFLKDVGENLARILTDSSDNSGYKSLLRLEGDSAQKMLNFLQTLLDCSELVSLPRNDILGALLRLSKYSKLYPECLTIKNLQRDGDVLDSGRFGEIYKGRSRNQTICLKVIKVNQKTQIKHLLKEALLWGHLSHPNILPFYGIYHLEDTRGRIAFVSPWMENGNVTEYLKRHPLANRLLLTWDIVLGIQFLHQNQVIHGDLKGLNVLVNRSGRGCLADFGLANLIDKDILHWTSIQTTGNQSGGTLRWQAPELIDPPSDESAKATPASDIYSFACVCYEIHTGDVPFHNLPRDVTVMKKVLEGSRPPRPTETSLLSDNIWKVIEMCWHQEPRNRPSAEWVIEQLPLVGIVDDRPSGNDHLAPSDFRAGGPENKSVMLDPAVDIILSSVLMSAQTNDVKPHAI